MFLYIHGILCISDNYNSSNLSFDWLFIAQVSRTQQNNTLSCFYLFFLAITSRDIGIKEHLGQQTRVFISSSSEIRCS